MGFRTVIQRIKHDGKDDVDIVTHKVDNVLVVPVVERALSNLEMLATHTSLQLLEQWHLYLGKLTRLNDIKHFFDFVKEHDFLL